MKKNNLEIKNVILWEIYELQKEVIEYYQAGFIYKIRKIIKRKTPYLMDIKIMCLLSELSVLDRIEEDQNERKCDM